MAEGCCLWPKGLSHSGRVLGCGSWLKGVGVLVVAEGCCLWPKGLSHSGRVLGCGSWLKGVGVLVVAEGCCLWPKGLSQSGVGVWFMAEGCWGVGHG